MRQTLLERIGTIEALIDTAADTDDFLKWNAAKDKAFGQLGSTALTDAEWTTIRRVRDAKIASYEHD